MKLTLKIFLVICLFSSITFAEGEMGTGGKTCSPGQTCVTGDGEMGTGGFTDGNQGNGGRAVNDQSESILTFIQKYLISIFE